jgi:hypothetical protein
VLVANGDHDIMVPSENSTDLARRIPGAELVLYPDAGHGGIFQYYDAFLTKAKAFLSAWSTRVARRRSTDLETAVNCSTASVAPPEVLGRRGPGLPTEVCSKERKSFQIDLFQRERGKWRASIRRSDSSKVRVKPGN